MDTKMYNKVRGQLNDCDFVLFKGSSIAANLIRWADKAHYNHVGIIWKAADRVLIIDAWDYGIEITPLSKRM